MQASVFPLISLQKPLVWASAAVLKLARSKTTTRGGPVNRKTAFIGAVVSSVLFAFGCATEEAAKPPAPAPKAAPAPAAAAPAPSPVPRQTAPTPPPAPKKPAVV